MTVDDDDGYTSLDEAIAAAVQHGGDRRTIEIHDDVCGVADDRDCTCTPRYLLVLKKGSA